MAYIVETNKLEELGVELEVLEKEKPEIFEPFKIIDFNADSMRIYTPDEIILLGQWLIEHGTRIKKAYKADGKLKKIKHGKDTRKIF